MKSKEKIILAVFTILFVGFFLIQNYFKLQSRIVFCDVGQGDGAFINLRGGAQAVIDGGPDNNMIGCLGKYMPYFDRRIEYLIISHPDADHFVGAIEVLKRYAVGVVLTNGEAGDSPEYKEFIKLAEGKIAPAASFGFNEGKVNFFNRPDGKYSDNDNSLVFKFLYSGKSILFTGDISEKGEALFLKQDLKSDILKISHHGSAESSSLEFLRAVSPKLAIISVGQGNKFGHPAYKILKRLENLGIKYLRTDEKGDIVVNLD
ncbi:MAG: MBL fold metallo-hydrolase [Patescibacteria group bacterium]